jgi:hypothetical protein
MAIQWADGGLTLGKIASWTLISAAVAAGVDPQGAAPVADWLNARPTTLFPALVAAVAFALVSNGRPLTRLRRATVGFLVAYLATDGLLYWAGLTGVAPVERAAASVLGFTGVYLAEAAMRMVERGRDRAGAIADVMLDVTVGRWLRGSAPHPPREGGDKAP